MLTHSTERFQKIQKEAPADCQKLLVQVTKYQAAKNCKTWIGGKWITPKEQNFAPPGAHFHQFVVPPILPFRRDCNYGDLAAMQLPHDVQGLCNCELERDAGRLADCRESMNFCPLGACALAGTGLLIDRFMTSDALGFTAPMSKSIDAVSDRDFVMELLSANSITAIHLSRLGEEWKLWVSEEFGFVTPSDAVSTGSSIMPQKKNPDPMELVRGKSARVVGDLVSLLVLCKGLPQAYNRDLQEDKEPVFDSVKTIAGMLEVSTEFAQNITFNQERIQKALPAGHLDATTLADYLVKKGIPFRTSHDIVGRAVALCVSRNSQLLDLSLDELNSISPVFDKEVYEFLGVENSIKKFSSYGSTGSECVANQLDYWIAKLEIQ